MNNIEPSPQAEFHQCFRCDYEEITDQTICPRCKKGYFFSATSIRKRGFILVLCGVFLAGVMGAVTVGVVLMLLGEMKDPRSAQKIIDEQFALFIIFGLFAMMVVMGLHFTLTGGWMMAFGKRNKILLWILLVLVFVVMLVAGLLTVFLP